jgi:hypothetical protein
LSTISAKLIEWTENKQKMTGFKTAISAMLSGETVIGSSDYQKFLSYCSNSHLLETTVGKKTL